MFLYAITILVSAFLLFQVQPVIAKIILPWFGGTAGVWTTCLLFFQMALLLGYLYSHALVRYLKPRAQMLTHGSLLLVSMLALPIYPSAAWKPADPGDPLFRILGLLAGTVGLPYFLLSTTGPLLQAWYSRRYKGAMPYRLYALSNAGSMFALLSYPVLFEPVFGVHRQASMWSLAYAGFAVLCGFVAFRAGNAPAAEETEAEEATGRPTARAYWLWLLLPACASGLLLSITNHLSQNIAAIPFLWVLPLSVYLLSFILCFESEDWYARNPYLGLMGLALGCMAYSMFSDNSANLPVKIGVPIFLMGLFTCCMVCHGELARLKPHPKYLTHFYLMISAGGALGGLLVGLVAPLVLNGLYELPVFMVVCAALAVIALRAQPDPQPRGEANAPAAPETAATRIGDLLFSFQGRITRAQWWGGQALLCLFAAPFVFAGIFLKSPVLWTAAAVVGAIPAAAISIKRCHDRGRSGWFNLVALVPGLNFWHLVEVAFLRGEEGENQYGPSPVRENRAPEWLQNLLPAPRLIAATAVVFLGGIFGYPQREAFVDWANGVAGWLRKGWESTEDTDQMALAAALLLAAALALIILRLDPKLRWARKWGGWAAFGAEMAVLLLAGYAGFQMREQNAGNRLMVRNFYGALKVKDSGPFTDMDAVRTLTHGTINHGEEYLNPARQMLPTTYYGPNTGIGLAIRAKQKTGPIRVGSIGLGTGTTVTYGRPGDYYRVYEINPLVLHMSIPEDPTKTPEFKFLRYCQAKHDVAMGDARLSLEREQPENFDVLAVDAFSSDSIPVHLLTFEAMKLFFHHLKPNGILAVHISNRYLDLEPVVLGEAQALGKVARTVDTDDDNSQDVFGATWVLVDAPSAGFDPMIMDASEPSQATRKVRLWTDDYSNLFQILK